MFRYEYSECPVCREGFTEDDDIAVCPVCGTPHHRECFLENKVCGNAELHSPDFVYKDKKQEIIARMEAAENEKLSRLPETDMDRADKSDEYTKAAEEMNSDAKTYQRVLLSKDEDIDAQIYNGVSERELQAFLGQSYVYHIVLFKTMILTKRKASLNIFAALLMPYYQFSRRMNVFAAFTAILAFAIDIPGTLYSLIQTGLFENTVFDADILQQIAAPLVYVYLVLRILYGFFNDYLYMRWSLAKIKKIRLSFAQPSDEYYAALAQVGNPGFIRGIVLGAITMLSLNLAFLGILYLIVK